MVKAWGSRVPGHQLHQQWGVKVRIDVAASMFSLHASLARSKRENKRTSLSEAAVAARALHSVR